MRKAAAKVRPRQEQSGSVVSEILFPDQQFIMSIRPENPEVNLFTWITEHEEFLADSILKYGGLRFSGFNLTPADFAKASNLILPNDVSCESYVGGMSPRTQVKDELFLSTLLPKKAVLGQHHEMSYMSHSPSKILFYCETPPTSGGQTTICFNRQFMKKIDPAIPKRFADRKVKYVRNYIAQSAMGIAWQKSFNTDDRATVEDFCKQSGLTCEWRYGDRLRTWNVGQGMIVHPITKENLWYNHSYMLNLASSSHPSQLSPCLRQFLPSMSSQEVENFKNTPLDEMPHNTFYGDGKPIELSILEEIHAVYESETRAFDWKKGDFMVLDNKLVSHGRNSYEGDQRRILAILKDRKLSSRPELIK